MRLSAHVCLQMMSILLLLSAACAWCEACGVCQDKLAAKVVFVGLGPVAKLLEDLPPGHLALLLGALCG